MDLSIALEVETSQATERGDVLILLPNRTAENFDFDPASLLRNGPRGSMLALECIERSEQTDRERARGAEASSRGDVGHADDLDGRADAMEFEGLPNDRMLNRPDILDPLQRRVLEEVIGCKRTVDADVDVPVDRGGDDESPESLVVRGQIRPASADRDPQRCACNEHGGV